MKKVFLLPVFVLAGCVSQTVEKIQSDPENIQKALSVQSRVNNNLEQTMKERRNGSDFQECVNNVKALTILKNKQSLTRDDMNTILKISPDFGDYYYVDVDDSYERQKQYYDVMHCKYDQKYKNLSLEQEIQEFCYNKYWRGNWATAVTLFPLRMTNELLAIGTLGIFTGITGTCRANGQGWLSDNNTTGFLGWCWKPGATWNYETCKQFIAGDNHELGSNNFMEEKHYWQFKNIEEKQYSFNSDDIDNLINKMDKFCETPTNFNPYANKLCKSDYINGCLVDLDGVSVATFGTRDNGVIVSTRLWGLELIISDQVFVYDSRDYYDGQDLKTDGYYYTYVGNYDAGLQKLPAFRRSQYRVYKRPKSTVEEWCNKRRH